MLLRFSLYFTVNTATIRSSQQLEPIFTNQKCCWPLTWPGRNSDQQGSTSMGEQAYCTLGAVNLYRASSEVADGIIYCLVSNISQRSKYTTPHIARKQSNNNFAIIFFISSFLRTHKTKIHDDNYLILFGKCICTRRGQRRSHKSFAFY